MRLIEQFPVYSVSSNDMNIVLQHEVRGPGN